MKSISCLLILIFFSHSISFAQETVHLLTIDDLREKYPNAIFKEVTFTEYYQIKRFLEKSEWKYDDLEESRFMVAQANSSKKEEEKEEEEEKDQKKSNPQHTSYSSRGDIRTPSVDLDDLAVVIFVVVAVFVVVALAFYAGKFVYDVVKDKGSRYGYWFEVGASGSMIFSETAERGILTSFKLATGFKGQKRYIGLMTNFGYLDVEFELNEEPKTIAFNGNYVVTGPTIRWYLQPDPSSTYFHLDLLAGTTEHREIGIMSIARAGLNFSAFEDFRFGISLGSLQVNLKKSEGLIRNDHDFNLLGGIDVGYAF